MRRDEPDWLAAWQVGRLDPPRALSWFDGLDGVAADAMLGRWRGVSLPTGHPLDGLLEGLGWWGKSFETRDRVHPLLCQAGSGEPVPLEPSLMPVGLALRMPGLAKSAGMRRAFRAALPVLRTARPAARLEQGTFRGKVSAAMVYRRLPITDHFRRIDDERVLGLMVLRRPGEPYFYFLLSREQIQPK